LEADGFVNKPAGVKFDEETLSTAGLNLGIAGNARTLSESAARAVGGRRGRVT
jgi:hypothetical protein